MPTNLKGFREWGQIQGVLDCRATGFADVKEVNDSAAAQGVESFSDTGS